MNPKTNPFISHNTHQPPPPLPLSLSLNLTALPQAIKHFGFGGVVQFRDEILGDFATEEEAKECVFWCVHG